MLYDIGELVYIKSAGVLDAYTVSPPPASCYANDAVSAEHATWRDLN